MHCLVGCLALFMPRVALVLVFIFSNYLEQAYQTLIWPLLGFIFLPFTTLAYAWAWHHGSGSVHGIGLVVVVIAVLMDLGSLGGSGHSSRRYYRRPRSG